MDKHDLAALLAVAERCCHSKRFDILQLVFCLFSSGAISILLCEQLEKLFTEGETCLRIIFRPARCCTFHQLVQALYMCNQANLAEQLLEERRNRGNTQIYTLARTGGFHANVAIFYKTLKTNIDNCAFRDKSDFLWRLAQYQKNEIRKHACGSILQIRAAHKLMVVHCLRLETFESTAERFSIIQDMNDGMSLAPVHAEVQSLFLSKLGSTYALERKFKKSDDYIRGAHSSLYMIKPSFPVHYIYLNEVFTKLVEYQHAPSDDVKSSLLFLGNRGLQSTKDDENGIYTRHIQLMLLSFMISCLLGVGINFEEINVPVTEWDKNYAKTLLVQFDSLSDELEYRREMVYCYLMAKLLEHSDRQKALSYGLRAEVLSENGAFRESEKRNINRFVDSLRAAI